MQKKLKKIGIGFCMDIVYNYFVDDISIGGILYGTKPQFILSNKTIYSSCSNGTVYLLWIGYDTGNIEVMAVSDGDDFYTFNYFRVS